jgi:hypothetical protein
MRLAEWHTVYSALSCRQRVHFWCTVGFWGLGGVGLLASDAPGNPVKGGDIVTFSNLVSLAGALIAAGTVWQQWQDAKEKIRKLDEAVEDLRNDTIPKTYVRQDVFEARMRALAREHTEHERA